MGVYDGDGNYISPIRTVLDDVAFNDVAPDNSTITFEIFRTGGGGVMTVRATVEADCEIEGLIDKGDFLARESDFTYAEDWIVCPIDLRGLRPRRLLRDSRARPTLHSLYIITPPPGLRP